MKVFSNLRNTFKTISSKTEKITQDLKKIKQKELEEIELLDRNIVHKSKASNIKEVEKIGIDRMGNFMFWIAGAIVLYLGFVVYQSLDLIYLIIAAYILSVAMESIILTLQNYFRYRGVAIAVSYILILGFIISGFLLIVPFILDQSADIIKMFLVEIERFHQILKEQGILSIIQNSTFLPGYIKKIGIESLSNKELLDALQSGIQSNIDQIMSYGSSYIKNVGSLIVTIVTGFFSAIIKIMLVFVLAVFFSLEMDGVVSFMAAFSYNKPYFKAKIEKLFRKLGFRLKGQLLLSVFIGVTVGVLLQTLSFISPFDLPSKFTLSLIAGITEFIPIIGPILGAVPAVMVAIVTYGWRGFVVVAVMYYVVQWFENNVLVPIVMNKALGLSPLVIFVAMMLGGSVLGFIGVVLSVPLAVIATLAFEDFVGDDR